MSGEPSWFTSMAVTMIDVSSDSNVSSLTVGPESQTRTLNTFWPPCCPRPIRVMLSGFCSLLKSATMNRWPKRPLEKLQSQSARAVGAPTFQCCARREGADRDSAKRPIMKKPNFIQDLSIGAISPSREAAIRMLHWNDCFGNELE